MKKKKKKKERSKILESVLDFTTGHDGLNGIVS